MVSPHNAAPGYIIGPTFFLLYINDLPNDVICNIAIYADDTTLYSKCDQASDLWQQLELASKLKSDLQDTVDWGKKWIVDFNAGKTLLVSSDQSNKTGVVNKKMDGSVFVEKLSLKILGLSSSTNLDWAFSYIICIAKTASKKIGVLIRSMKFLSPEVALYLYKSKILPGMEYCCHIWDGVPSYYLELLDKLQKQIYKTVGPSLAASFESLAHDQNVPTLILFYWYSFDNVFLNWFNWFYFLILVGGLLIISIDCMTFLPPFLDTTRMSLSICQQFLSLHSWNSLPIECYSLSYDLNGFNSGISSRHLLTVGSCCTSFSCNSMPRSGCSVFHGVNPN